MDTGKPKASMYGHPQYEALNSHQKKYYDAIIAMKKSKDALIPKGENKAED